MRCAVSYLIIRRAFLPSFQLNPRQAKKYTAPFQIFLVPLAADQRNLLSLTSLTLTLSLSQSNTSQCPFVPCPSLFA